MFRYNNFSKFRFPLAQIALPLKLIEVRRICICAWLSFCLFGRAEGQVGINTTEPRAQLDIQISNPTAPEITDGILIPRIDNFPAAQPTLAQDGMLVYLKTGKEDFPTGFYYWNASTSGWTSISNTTLFNFYKQGSTLPAEGVLEGIYRTGNIGIGAESPEVKLKVVLSSETDHSIRTALEIDNSSSSPANVTYGILNNNRSLTNDRKYGIKTNVSAAGKGVHYGIYNEVYQNSIEEIYGIYNKVGRTYGASKNHYGIYSEIGTPLGAGFAYGIYSVAWGSVPERVFAGYFAGRLGIGVSYETHYVLPEGRGSRNQILRQDAEGRVIWSYPNRSVFSSTGSATGNFVIADDIHSLRIDEPVSSITIPDASLNNGRILLLLAWNGISTKAFNFLSGDDIWDVGSASAVSSISGGERLTIQSDGNRWLLIGRQ